MVENDGLHTLPTELIEKISIRADEEPSKYSPSYIIRIINKSIASADQDAQKYPGVRKGHLMQFEPEQHQTLNNNTIARFVWNGKEIFVEGMSFPGITFGIEIFKELDKKISTIEGTITTPRDAYFTAAFLTIVASTTHPFSSANGRSSVGLADAYMRKNIGRSIDYAQLVLRNKELVDRMAQASLSLLPKEYELTTLMSTLQASDQRQIVLKIPHMQNAKPTEVKKILEEYTKQIIHFIHEFEPEKLSIVPTLPLNINYNLVELATLFREVSVKNDAVARAREIPRKIRNSLSG